MPEEQYHAYRAYSYSMIARYARQGFRSIPTLHSPINTTPEMQFGSLVDSLLTRGKAETAKHYHVATIPLPQPAEKQVIEALVSVTNAPYDAIPEETITTTMEDCAYYPRYKTATKLGNLREASWYYEILRSGKTIVSTEDYEDALVMCSTLQNDSYLKTLFGTKSTDDVEYLYQTQFVTKMKIEKRAGEYETALVKIMPDLLKVDHIQKTIQPVDLKTSGMPAYDFPEHFVKMRYDIQASLYTDVLDVVIRNSKDFADYTILPYLFTDISRVDKVPVTYTYDPRSEEQINGLNVGNGRYTYKGWRKLLGEILVYEESKASVPYYIKREEPNDLISLLNKQ